MVSWRVAGVAPSEDVQPTMEWPRQQDSNDTVRFLTPTLEGENAAGEGSMLIIECEWQAQVSTEPERRKAGFSAFPDGHFFGLRKANEKAINR